jgi:Na+/melibiose symporter-like transporter
LNDQPITRFCAIAYSLPVGGVAFLLLPAGVVLQDIYPQYYGLRFAAIASAFFWSSMAVALINPILGVLSDWYKARVGGRKSWTIAGFMMFVISSHCLLAPLQPVTAAYFAVCLAATQIFWIAFDVPHLAWGAELAYGYDMRTRLFSIRNCVVTVGGSCFYVLPLLPIFDSSAITPQTLKYAAVIGLLYFLPAAFCAVRFVPETKPSARAEAWSIRHDLKLILCNKPFIIFTLASVFQAFGEGMWMALMSVIFDYYYKIGSKFAAMYLSGSIVAAVGFPIFVKASASIGKKGSFAILQLAFIALISAGFFISPGPYAYIPLTGILIGVSAIVIFNTAITQAILADIADYGLWKFGRAQAGGYYAVLYFFEFLIGGLGAPLGLTILDRFGFSPHGITDMAAAKIAVGLAFFLIPAIMTGVALVFIWKIPICAHRAAAIRRRIALRSKYPRLSHGATLAPIPTAELG